MFGIFAMLSLIGYFSVIQVGISIIIPPSSIVANGMGEVFVGFTNFNVNFCMKKKFTQNETKWMEGRKGESKSLKRQRRREEFLGINYFRFFPKQEKLYKSS
jgi:hypothetical protein